MVMVVSMIRTKETRVVALVMVLALVGATPAQAGLDESIAAAREGKYAEAAKEIVTPVRETIEDGICDVVVAAMPSVERSIASIEALMADVYYFGHFVPKDYDVAVKWYLRAGEKGNALAQSALGDIYYNGRGMLQDYKTAAAWWERAAEQGVGGAQLNLSVLYANGEGVERDLVKSHMYANLAAAQLPLGKDYEIAVQNREYIAQQMTPEQIAEAQQRAKAWQPVSERNKQESEAEADRPAEAGQAAGPKRCRW
jgi:hypothetical protein